MTNSTIPYAFTPGTKAKAQEVNANFNALAEKIDANNANILHDNDNSTITGQKTFTNPINSIGCHTDTKGNLTVSGINNELISDTVIGLNESNVKVGSLRMQNGEGFNDVSLTASDENGNIQLMGLRNNNGNAWGYAPTYTENYADNSDKIVTTAYMTNHWATPGVTTVNTASHARPAVVIFNYVNGVTWFRIWSDNFVEQGGLVPDVADETLIRLPVSYPNADYTCLLTIHNAKGGKSTNNMKLIGKDPSHILIWATWNERPFHWYTCGY